MTTAAGRFFDGQTAGRHEVELRLDEAAGVLVISGPTLGADLRWPLDRLRALPDHAPGFGLTVTLHAESGDESPRDPARLSFSDTRLIRVLTRACPGLHRKDLHKGTWGRLIRMSALAAGALVLMLFVILPRMADTLAALLPVEREIAFGKAVTAQIERALGGTELGALRCSAPEGQASLDRMIGRLTEGQSLQYDVNVVVFDHEMVNAFAAPGGQVVLMRGLLEDAPGPDAVAAVLAHEIGHVERRDATRHALRAAGSAGLLSMVRGDFTGGTIAVILGERMIRANYTREAELAADAFALGMITAAGIDSTGMAAFFDKLAEMEQGLPRLPEYFSTHPASADRARRARANADAQTGTSPALSEEEWRALRAICD